MPSIFGNAVQKHFNQDSSNLKNPEPWLGNLVGGSNSAGVSVNERTALELSPYFNAVNLISDHCAQHPFFVIQKDYSTNNIEVLADHNITKLIQHEPAPFLDGFQFRKLMTLWKLNWGNAYSLIERNGSGLRINTVNDKKFKNQPRNEVVKLHPKKPWETTVIFDKEKKQKLFKFKDEDGLFKPRDVIHLKQFSTDGIVGRSIIDYAADRFSGHLATEKYGEKFYKNGTHMGGILTVAEDWGRNAENANKIKSAIRRELRNVYGGEPNWHNIGIFDKGDKIDYQNLTLPADEAQLIERSKFSIEDVARWTGVPVSKLKGDQNTSYNTREFEALDFIQDGLMPRLEVWQQELRRKLLSEEEKKEGYQILIDIKKLEKADLKSTAEYLAKLVDRAIMTPNQALEFLDMDTYEGGDIHLMQRNMTTLENFEEEGNQTDTEVVDNFANKLKETIEQPKAHTNGHSR